MSAPLQLIAAILGSEDDAKQLLMVMDAAGLVIVPRIPTSQMLDAAWAAAQSENAAEVWREMIETSQT